MKKGILLLIGLVSLLILANLTSCQKELLSIIEDKSYIKLDKESHNILNSYSAQELLSKDFNNEIIRQEIISIKPIDFYSNLNSINLNENTKLNGIMDSAWPMYCHDLRHTGQSPYSTADNPGAEIWRYRSEDWIEGSGVLDHEGYIYFGSNEGFIYSLYQNGTLKWRCNLNGVAFSSSPAISEFDNIYIGSSWAPFDENHLYAIDSNNGTLIWKYRTNEIFSSPAIGPDGTIYFGDSDEYIHALYPNGTLRWRYKTNHVVYSSPAIGDDGTIYCGSHDSKLYALNPNGTLKWTFDTGDWIRVSPCIGDDGTIYCVSLDNYLYALNPDGTMKWKTNVGAGTSPTIGLDGTIYCGYDKLKAINPDGSLKWELELGADRTIRGGTPCHSAEGTIYLGTTIYPYWGGEIVAVSLDGTESWRKMIADEGVEFAPIIAEDGTIYIGSSSDDSGDTYGFLHAFGIGDLIADAGGPYHDTAGDEIQFKGLGFGGTPPYTWQWDFGDGNTSDEQNPIHIYASQGTGAYNVTLTVIDSELNNATDNTTAFIVGAHPYIAITKPEPALYIWNMKLFPVLRSSPLIFGPIDIEVSAGDYDDGIDYVEFYIDGVLKNVDEEPPYMWKWTDRVFFSHTILAKAYDFSELQASHEIQVRKFF